MNEKAFGASERCIHRLEELLREGASTESIALMRRAYAEVDNARKLLEQTESAVTEIRYCYREMQRDSGQILKRIEDAIAACRASAGKNQNA